MGLLNDLKGGPVALDTAVFIYFFEEHPKYLPLVEPVFLAIDDGKLEAVTSAVTLLETIVVPLRAGNSALADRYEEFLTNSQGLRLLHLSLDLLKEAALSEPGLGRRPRMRFRLPQLLRPAAHRW